MGSFSTYFISQPSLKCLEKFFFVIQEIYIDQESPYLMRQICVLQWEEINTRNFGATHHFWGKGPKGWNKNILLVYFPY